MDVVLLILKILLAIVSVGAIVIVLLQDGADEGLGGVIAGGSSESFLGKNKGADRKAKLSKLTVILSLVFAVIVVAVDIIIGRM